jgi:nucleoside-diphosphate kinase
MAIERTLSIIKPDGVSRDLIGEILGRFEKNGLRVVATRMQHLSKGEAEGFYAVHKERPFFGELVEYMTSGPVVLSILEGENAVLHHRALLGATDPSKAEPGTIRADFGIDIGTNTVHGSDATETAAVETSYFFRGTENYSNR